MSENGKEHNGGPQGPRGSGTGNGNGNGGQPPGQSKTYQITVNGRPREVRDHKLSYEDVVRLAFPEDQPDASLVYTVSYANPHGRDGTLAAGQEVTVKDGMSFNVGKTNRS